MKYNPPGRTPTITDVFVSHSSRDKKTAERLTADLTSAAFSVWIDTDYLATGDELRPELMNAIRASNHMVLLWSEASSKSDYVFYELDAAYRLNKVIMPCLLDGTDLPQRLKNVKYADLRNYEEGSAQLVRGLRSRTLRPPDPAAKALEDAEVLKAAAELNKFQMLVIQQLTADVSKARIIQDKLDDAMTAALRTWPHDAMILNLAGYHRKNDYMIRHWDLFSKGEYVSDDPTLEDGIRLFHDSLSHNPNDPSALNGLSNFLMFKGELNKATFYNDCALEEAKKSGYRYEAAEIDREQLRRLRAKLALASH